MAEFSRILPLVVASALFMENMDSTVIATSLPAIAGDLKVDPVVLKLAFTTYLLSLTGFITTYFPWRWIFLINVPVGIVGLILATVLMPDIRADRTPRLDTIGFILSGAGLSALVFGLTVLGRDLLPDEAAIALVLGGTV